MPVLHGSSNLYAAAEKQPEAAAPILPGFQPPAPLPDAGNVPPNTGGLPATTAYPIPPLQQTTGITQPAHAAHSQQSQPWAPQQHHYYGTAPGHHWPQQSFPQPQQPPVGSSQPPQYHLPTYPPTAPSMMPQTTCHFGAAASLPATAATATSVGAHARAQAYYPQHSAPGCEWQHQHLQHPPYHPHPPHAPPNQLQVQQWPQQQNMAPSHSAELAAAQEQIARLQAEHEAALAQLEAQRARSERDDLARRLATLNAQASAHHPRQTQQHAHDGAPATARAPTTSARATDQSGQPPWAKWTDRRPADARRQSDDLAQRLDGGELSDSSGDDSDDSDGEDSTLVGATRRKAPIKGLSESTCRNLVCDLKPENVPKWLRNFTRRLANHDPRLKRLLELSPTAAEHAIRTDREMRKANVFIANAARDLFKRDATEVDNFLDDTSDTILDSGYHLITAIGKLPEHKTSFDISAAESEFAKLKPFKTGAETAVNEKAARDILEAYRRLPGYSAINEELTLIRKLPDACKEKRDALERDFFEIPHVSVPKWQNTTNLIALLCIELRSKSAPQPRPPFVPRAAAADAAAAAAAAANEAKPEDRCLSCGKVGHKSRDCSTSCEGPGNKPCVIGKNCPGHAWGPSHCLTGKMCMPVREECIRGDGKPVNTDIYKKLTIKHDTARLSAPSAAAAAAAQRAAPPPAPPTAAPTAPATAPAAAPPPPVQPPPQPPQRTTAGTQASTAFDFSRAAGVVSFAATAADRDAAPNAVASSVISSAVSPTRITVITHPEPPVTRRVISVKPLLPPTPISAAAQRAQCRADSIAALPTAPTTAPTAAPATAPHPPTAPATTPISLAAKRAQQRVDAARTLVNGRQRRITHARDDAPTTTPANTTRIARQINDGRAAATADGTIAGVEYSAAWIEGTSTAQLELPPSAASSATASSPRQRRRKRRHASPPPDFSEAATTAATFAPPPRPTMADFLYGTNLSQDEIDAARADERRRTVAAADHYNATNTARMRSVMNRLDQSDTTDSIFMRPRRQMA